MPSDWAVCGHFLGLPEPSDTDTDDVYLPELYPTDFGDPSGGHLWENTVDMSIKRAIHVPDQFLRHALLRGPIERLHLQ